MAICVDFIVAVYTSRINRVAWSTPITPGEPYSRAITAPCSSAPGCTAGAQLASATSNLLALSGPEASLGVVVKVAGAEAVAKGE